MLWGPRSKAFFPSRLAVSLASAARAPDLKFLLPQLGGVRFSSKDSSSPPPEDPNAPKVEKAAAKPSTPRTSDTFLDIIQSEPKKATPSDVSALQKSSPKPTSVVSPKPTNVVSEIFQLSKLRLKNTAVASKRSAATNPSALDVVSIFKDTSVPTNSHGESHVLHIHASANNTIVSLESATTGSTICWASGGTAGFKKSARSGFEPATQAALQLLEKMEAKNVQVEGMHVVLKGFGPGRDAAFKALFQGSTWKVIRVTDATPIPFNGCRPPKRRRL